MPRDVTPVRITAFSLPPVLDDRWALVERVCASAHFRRSARLRDLLLYLCHRAWVENAEEIREHEIGTDVFQRPPEYDSAQDTLVRVQASQLRKRLEKYFAEDGQSEPLLLEIGKGTYIPVVHARHEPLAPVVVPPPAVAPPQDRRLVYGLAAACVALLCVCLWLALRPARPLVEGTTLRRFWAAFESGGRETFIVVADSSLSAVQDMLHRPILLNEYVSRSYKNELDQPGRLPEIKETLRYVMERRYTSLADVMVLRRFWMTSLLDPARTTIVFSRDHQLRAFHQGNHILVGSRRAVPWVDLFDDALDFHFVYDEATKRVRVENRRPRAGESKFYEALGRTPNGSESYSLVACLPNLSKKGHVLILSGQEMSGTEAAANLLTTENLLQDLLRRLPEPAAGNTPYFEALLKAKHVEYTTQGFEILAVHPHH